MRMVVSNRLTAAGAPTSSWSTTHLQAGPGGGRDAAGPDAVDTEQAARPGCSANPGLTLVAQEH